MNHLPRVETVEARPYERVRQIVTCPCGFLSGPHLGYDTAAWVASGHAVQASGRTWAAPC